MGLSFTGGTESSLLREIISWVAPVLVFFGLWVLFFRKIADKQGFGGGFMTIGKSRAKIFVEKDTKVTFVDVAGVDEAKTELEEIINFLKDPKRYGRLGGHPACRTSWHGQNPAGARRSRRSGGSILFHQRF